MGLDTVDLLAGERNKDTEFGLGPWTAVGTEMMGLGAADYWGGETKKSLNLGWALGLRWGRSC